MNKLIFSCCIFVLINFAFSQGAEHKIVELMSDKNVRVNIGQGSDLKKGDYFQVFGISEVIHPATGQLMVKENVYIGKLEIIKVEQTESICKIIEQKKYFQVNDKVRKVSKDVDSVIQQERDAQFEFESPQKRDYAETIYSKKPYPTRDISAKKLWFEGPFQLNKGMVSFSIPINFELYMDYDSYQRGQIATNIKVQYGLLNNFQITGLIPLIVKWDERKDQDEPYTGAGLSNLELEGLYSLDVRNLIKKIDTYDLFFSAGINYSIATDDGWGNYEFDSSGAPIIKLPISNGFNTLIFIASLGIQRQSMFAFLEYKYNIKGKRSDSEQGWSYNPTNNAELNLIGSFFINNRTKLRSEITVDDLQNKSGLILLKPSIHKLITESFVWSFGFFFPIKNDYDYNYFGLNMGFTWINY